MTIHAKLCLVIVMIIVATNEISNVKSYHHPCSQTHKAEYSPNAQKSLQCVYVCVSFETFGTKTKHGLSQNLSLNYHL